jgi:alcohol-forming fatty acyl-CoA reductase
LKAFDTIRKLFPERLIKLKVISGDVSSDGLGISNDDELELIENVGFIFHCAAVVRFDFSLMDAMKTNVMGTHRILQLAEKIKNFQSFVYVSTTFSQSYQSSLDERYYCTGFDIFTLMDFVKSNDKQSIDNVEKE